MGLELNVAIYSVTAPETVVVFYPLRLSEVPQASRKLQLTGLTTVVDPTPQTVSSNQLNISIQESLDMSVSKTAVQAAHAAQLFIMYANESEVKDFIKNGCSIFLNRDTFNEDNVDAIYVKDAGFTEIPSGSLTARAVFKR